MQTSVQVDANFRGHLGANQWSLLLIELCLQSLALSYLSYAMFAKFIWVSQGLVWMAAIHCILLQHNRTTLRPSCHHLFFFCLHRTISL